MLFTVTALLMCATTTCLLRLALAAATRSGLHRGLLGNRSSRSSSRSRGRGRCAKEVGELRHAERREPGRLLFRSGGVGSGRILRRHSDIVFETRKDTSVE